jgi:hypothetical protein
MIDSGAKVVMTLAAGSNNTLVAGSNAAGLGVYNNSNPVASLTITGTGTLTATGGRSGAGIGGYNSTKAGTIIINSGTVTANGGGGAAGIGGGYGAGGWGGDVTITGNANVTATGGSDYNYLGEHWCGGAGIGSGCTTGDIPVPPGTVHIDTTGTVVATGGLGHQDSVLSASGDGAPIGTGGAARPRTAQALPPLPRRPTHRWRWATTTSSA